MGIRTEEESRAPGRDIGTVGRVQSQKSVGSERSPANLRQTSSQLSLEPLWELVTTLFTHRPPLNMMKVRESCQLGTTVTLWGTFHSLFMVS